jgi:hypothetical protein
MAKISEVVIVITHEDWSKTTWTVSPSRSVYPSLADDVHADASVWGKDADYLEKLGFTVPRPLNAKIRPNEHSVWIM